MEMHPFDRAGRNAEECQESLVEIRDAAGRFLGSLVGQSGEAAAGLIQPLLQKWLKSRQLRALREAPCTCARELGRIAKAA